MTSPSLDPLFVSFQLALAGRYSIDRELGRGGMGVVYLAREVHLDRMVAIKLLPPDRAADTAVRERFVREARMAAKLSHPNIIPIHAVAETADFVFYVMSYVDGETLAQRVRSRGPLPGSEAMRIFRDVAWALSYAHAHGLVHRDVKPDNILLEHGTGRVFVTDFGIAAVAHDVTDARVSGTPEFMSPEQALGRELDARSDVYSFGVMAFYALSGRLPFEAATATGVLAKQITEPAPPLASAGIPVPRKLAALVDRCLAKDPAQRPASADTLADQLGTTLQQRRELPVALRAFVKRSSRVNGSGALLLLIGAAAATGLVVDDSGFLGHVTTFVGTGLAGAFAYCVNAARRLTRLGFAHADVVPAFATEIEQAREEAALQHSGGRPVGETILLTAACTSGAIWVCSMLLLGSGHSVFENLPYLEEIFGVSAIILFPSMLAYLSMLQRRRDIDMEFWSKLWSGRVGKAAFWLARPAAWAQQPASAVTHRATELVLSMAAESLYESLPEPVRRSLGDVPALVRQLQRHAQRLREVYEDVENALTSGIDPTHEEAQRTLRAESERIHAKLTESVRALETIRLNLLRLHAGSATVAALTTEIDLAAAVSADADRMLAARQEVDGLLLYPRVTAPTPA